MINIDEANSLKLSFRNNMTKDGLYFKKIGMIGVLDERDKYIPATVLKLIDTTLVKDINNKLQVFVEFGSYLKKPQKGNLKSIKSLYSRENLKGCLRTINSTEALGKIEVGSRFTLEQLNCNYVDIQGVSKGKGFQGVMKRHNFAGGRASHGNSISHRAHGGTGCGRSIGPERVLKGKKMAGHMGHETCTQLHLKVLHKLEDKYLVVKGSTPGPKNSVVHVKKSIKEKA